MDRSHDKTAAALVLGLLAWGLLAVGCNAPTPPPTPPPTPTQAVMASTDLERPTSSTVFNTSLAVTLAAGETTGRILSFTSCVAPAVANLPAGLSVDFYAMQSISITQLSHTGSTAGSYLDPLVPYASGCLSGSVFVDITVATGTTPGPYAFQINDLPVAVTVNTFPMPAIPSVPIYMGLDPYSVLAAHGLSSNSTVDVQAPLAMSYVNLLRAHRIEPFGAVVSYPPIVDGTLDIDQFSEYGGSFRQMEITGSLGEVCMAVHDTSIQTQSYYQAIDATITGLGISGWNYLIDEPDDSTLAAVVAPMAQLSKQYAPHLETMITHQPATELIGLIDHFTVLFEEFKTPGFWSDYSQAPNYWLYGSCESHGSCSNGVVGTNTGSPDLMIDQTTINARMFPVVVAASGAQAGVYYSVDNDYGTLDVWSNQYQFGGNGDGQLVYPAVEGQRGFTSNFALASLRLKMLRQGMFDVEYLRYYGFSSDIITDQFTWTQNHADLDALRQKSVAAQ